MLRGGARLPYVVQLFRWGHGWGRWHADLTDAVNRDTKAQLIAETIRQFKIVQPSCPVFIVAQIGWLGGGGQSTRAVWTSRPWNGSYCWHPAMSPGYDLARVSPRRLSAGRWWFSGHRWTCWSWEREHDCSARSIGSSQSAREWWVFVFPAIDDARCRQETRATPNCARFAGGLEWRSLATSGQVVIWDQILLDFSGSTLCRC